VIGAQIGDGELSNQMATAQDRPAESAILNAWTSTPRSMDSNSLSGRPRHFRRPVTDRSQPLRHRLNRPPPVTVADVTGAGFMTLILPH
jgi:hypothetical protein